MGISSGILNIIPVVLNASAWFKKSYFWWYANYIWCEQTSLSCWLSL